MTESLPPFDLGAPGPMRDRLVEAVLARRKTATSSLRVHYDMDNAWLPRAGARFRLVNSARDELGTIETTRVDVMRLGDVTDGIARAEGEGFASAADWRAAHMAYWDQFREQVRMFLGDPTWTIHDDTEVVVEHFRLV